MTHISGKKKTEIVCEKSQMSYLKDKDFKASIINAVKENDD